ncbi:MAG: hypothetical protein AB1512_32840 [Thermodesulfobacteriota bacterium]
MTDIDPISLDGVRTYSLKDRKSKVQLLDFGRAWKPGGDMRSWLQSLPRTLGAESFTRVINSLVQATRSGRMVILAMGAHAIKVGLNPVILDLMDRGILKGLAMNGACIIHDAEIAMAGHTSEDVAAHLGDGTFGMAEETGQFLNQAIREGAAKGLGIGRAVGAMLVKEAFPHNRYSLLAGAYERNIPVTVHVALGTDIIHCHPAADGAAIGEASHLDFRIFAGLVSRLEGGVYINLGSAVVLPEVFLKALSLVRNLGHEVKNFTAVNMDFLRQYRPMTNVVDRPTLEGGEGYNLVGHHEIMFPLLAAAVLEGLEAETKKGKEQDHAHL